MKNSSTSVSPDNKPIILDHEKRFAATLANGVLHKPKLSSWMIFIPFIFIFYFQDFSNYKKQRRAFIDNYLLSRKRALNEAERALTENRNPDIDAVANRSELKEKPKVKYKELLTLLMDHYTSLLNASGENFEALVKSAYGKKKMNYAVFIHQLNTAEKALNAALKPQLKKTEEGVSQTIRKIETRSEKLRRQQLEMFYD